MLVTEIEIAIVMNGRVEAETAALGVAPFPGESSGDIPRVSSYSLQLRGPSAASERWLAVSES